MCCCKCGCLCHGQSESAKGWPGWMGSLSAGMDRLHFSLCMPCFDRIRLCAWRFVSKTQATSLALFSCLSPFRPMWSIVQFLLATKRQGGRHTTVTSEISTPVKALKKKLPHLLLSQSKPHKTTLPLIPSLVALSRSAPPPPSNPTAGSCGSLWLEQKEATSSVPSSLWWLAGVGWGWAGLAKHPAKSLRRDVSCN